MTNANAQAEKEKGNAAFKRGEYPIAIGHYTAASLADRSDPMYPLNRAAAYLKLGKYEDAEKDSTTVLSLSPLNAKAFFRRGQARVGLGKFAEALTDFTQALQREPTSESVKEEIKKVNELLEKSEAKGKSKPPPHLSSESQTVKRRRVPIKIVDSTEPEAAPNLSLPSLAPNLLRSTSETNAPIDTLIPVSTRSLKDVQGSRFSHSQASDRAVTKPSLEPNLQNHRDAQAAPEPSTAARQPGRQSVWRADSPSSPSSMAGTYTEAKEARQGRVGGGIFRASGASKIFPTRATPSGVVGITELSSSISPLMRANIGVNTSPAPRPETMDRTKASMSLFDFQKALERHAADDEKWDLIKSVPPLSLLSLFKTSLEPALFMSIITVFESILGVGDAMGTNQTASASVREYMDAFAFVERFGTIMLFLSRDEKTKVRRVWEILGVKGDAELANIAVGKVWRPIWT